MNDPPLDASPLHHVLIWWRIRLPQRIAFATEADSTAAAWFDSFGHAHRVAVLRVLATGEKTANEVAKAAGVEVPNAKGHLAKLKAAGLVTARRIGNRKCYALVSVTRTATALEFTHPSGARAVVPVGEYVPPVFITIRKKS